MSKLRGREGASGKGCGKGLVEGLWKGRWTMHGAGRLPPPLKIGMMPPGKPWPLWIIEAL